MKVAVLGAGPMGLAAAYQLARDGHQVTLYEADDRLGGMSASFDFNGIDIERYYHFHCTSDAGLLELLEELDLSEKMQWTETRMGYWYRNKIQDWGNPIALLRFDGLSLMAKIRYGLHAFLSTKRKDWRPLDQLNAKTWIQRWIGQEAWDVCWQTLFDYKFYQYADNLSAAWIWSRIQRVGRSRYSMMREKLGYLEGGSETILQAMAEQIRKNGGDIHLSRPVQEIVIESGRLCGLRTANETVEAYDKVISTIPLPFIAQLAPGLSQVTREQYQALPNIAVACVIAKLARPLTDKFWLNINDPDMDIPGLVEYTNLRPMGYDHIVYVPFYMPAEHPEYQKSDEHFREKVLGYFLRINPELTESEVLDLKVSRYRFAQPVCRPGFMSDLPDYRTEIPGLWIADTSYYYPHDRGISESIDFGRKLARESVQ
ncbi:oxidoreductase [Pseudohongiella nitratireducens]|uniref:Oxidoreductase n=1 Tax=Pseudohongiella nitratireducens TaxID=1768907 RepID=A0A916VJG0_9GAMM|nr:NAD(P)/FAD-dependent oxidoreductase [Pseudohongiella nitratireducens]MDF1623279.1 NAD(P)/FAD-dependent oxidoreductase [Pseudohongiella nitratireducens]GFZ75702.1 oxidoreductase [Pseudohongiella nitratireducens]|tara:strand:+ start:3057 stop:4343 length:1287 start_codon:yes stop_codon:yes gene_type:complete